MNRAKSQLNQLPRWQATRECMQFVPMLIPIYSHRFLPGAPSPAGSPVFSVYQTDVIYCGSDLAAYVAAEFFRRLR